MVLDEDGNVCIAGNTTSEIFPIVSRDAHDASFNGGAALGDAFIARIDSTLSTVLYSSYFGGTLDDAAEAVGVRVIESEEVDRSTDSVCRSRSS